MRERFKLKRNPPDKVAWFSEQVVIKSRNQRLLVFVKFFALQIQTRYITLIWRYFCLFFFFYYLWYYGLFKRDRDEREKIFILLIVHFRFKFKTNKKAKNLIWIFIIFFYSLMSFKVYWVKIKKYLEKIKRRKRTFCKWKYTIFS